MIEQLQFGGLGLRFLRSKDDTGNSLDMFEMVVQPKANMPVPHYHESWDETIYGLTGTTTFTIDGQKVPISAGETAFIRRGIVHGFINDSDTPSSCLCVLTPGVLGMAYFREIGAVMSAGKPDPARLREIMLRHGLVPVPA